MPDCTMMNAFLHSHSPFLRLEQDCRSDCCNTPWACKITLYETGQWLAFDCSASLKADDAKSEELEMGSYCLTISIKCSEWRKSDL